MEASEMTPEELRRYAAEKEASRHRLEKAYLGYSAPEPEAPAPWVRKVEVDGTEYTVDMRPFKSREFFKRAAAIQDQKSADAISMTDMIGFYEFCFGGDGGVDEQVTAHVRDMLGYEDYEEVLRIEDKVFEAVDAKN